MIVQGAYTKFGNVYEIARGVKTELDVNPKQYSEAVAEARYKNFLDVKYKNPTIASVAMQEVYDRNPIKSSKNYRANITSLGNKYEIRVAQKKVLDRIHELYPKTESIREFLVQNGRIRLFETTKKLSGIKKLLLKLKFMM